MVFIINAIFWMFFFIMLGIVILIWFQVREDPYNRALKKSIKRKKLELTDKALSANLSSEGLPPIEQLLATGQIIKKEEGDKDKPVNKIGF